MAKFCNKCNYPIEEGGNYCTECGSNDIRDDSIQPQKNIKANEEEETPTKLEEIDLTNDVNTPIPELSTDFVRSFGDRSIERLQSSDIKPINDVKENTSDDSEPQDTQPQDIQQPEVEIPQTSTINNTQSRDSLQKNTYADVPDYMNNPDQINIPTDFQLQEEKTDDYSTPKKIQTNNPRRVQRKVKKKKKDNTNFKIAFTAGVIIVLIFMFSYFYSYGKNTNETPFSNNDLNSSGIPGNTIDYSTIFTAENSFRVGDPGVGYISIPKNWAQVSQQESGPALQYTDGMSWVVTLMAAPTAQYSAVAYANNVYNSIKAGGGQNITTGRTAIAGYTALTITAAYPNLNKYLTTWCFESKIGQTHYLAIEGPSSSGDNYNIIYSFKDDK